MSAENGEKDKKSKKDEVKYFSSSESSVTSPPTQVLSFESASTPADLIAFEFPLDSPIVERRPSQETSSQPQAVQSELSMKPSVSRDATMKSPRKQVKCSSPAKNVSKDSPPQKQQKCQSPSTMGAVQQQSKTFTPINEEERCLLDSESSESSIERIPEPPQQKTEPLAVNLEKRRSSSLPAEVSPEVQQVTSSDESKKRTKSEGQIKPSGKDGKQSPKKRSPIKKAIDSCGKVFTFLKVHDKKDKAKVEATDCIQELSEESGDGKDQGNFPDEPNVACAAASSIEPNDAQAATESIKPKEDESEQRKDPDPETPRRSRRIAKLNEPHGASSSKKRDLKK